MKNIEQTQKVQEEGNREKKNTIENQTRKNYKREREQRKEGRESLDVGPQARDQSKRVPLKEASI